MDRDLNDIILKYLNNAETWNLGGFMTALAETYYRADYDNRATLQPVMQRIMEKYPEYSVARGR